jgi:hypothetical protein
VLAKAAAWTLGVAAGAPARGTTGGPGPGGARWLVSAPADAALWIVPVDDPRGAHRVAIRPQGLAGVQVTRDGRDAFVATHDGWVGRIDLLRGVRVAEVRVAERLAGLAVAADGGHLAVAAIDPPALVVLDRRLAPLNRLDGADAAGALRSPVASVADATARRSFVAALPALREVWEVSYDPAAHDLPAGMIHDFRFREGAFVRGYLNPRRIRVDEAPAQLHVAPALHEVMAADGHGAALHVVHLDVRRRIGTLPLAGPPLLERAVGGAPGAAGGWWVPVRGGGLALVDPDRVRVLRTTATRAEVAAIAAHDRAPRAWLAYAGSGPRDLLEPLGADGAIGAPGWRPAPGAPIAAVAYDAAGERLAVAFEGDEGGLAAHDATTLQQAWRLRLPRPASIRALPPAADVSR